MQTANSVRHGARWMTADALRIADTVAGERSTPAMIALALMAQIAYEEGDPGRAGSLLQELMQIPITLMPIESPVRAYPLLARIHAIRDGLSHAVQQLTEREKLVDDRGSAPPESCQGDSSHGSAAQPQDAILTPRETHVLRLIGGGLSNKRIARDLQIAPETVKSHAKHIFAKLGTRTRAESITRAVKLCIL